MPNPILNNPTSHFSMCSYRDNFVNLKSIPRDHIKLLKFNSTILANLNKKQHANALLFQVNKYMNKWNKFCSTNAF